MGSQQSSGADAPRKIGFWRCALAALALLALLGCSTAEERLAAQQPAHHEQCAGYGHKPGTPDYALCRQMADLMYLQEMRAHSQRLLAAGAMLQQSPPAYSGSSCVVDRLGTLNCRHW